MRTRTVIEHIGENMGPVDWSYNFLSHFDNCCTTPEGKAEFCEEAKARLRKVVEDPQAWEATSYGGWPRCGWGAVLDVGMYDGWPYWRPVPSICVSTPLGGGEWHSFSSITNIRRKDTGETL